MLKDEYTRITSLLDLPEKFEHTLYRILIAFFVIESTRMVIVLAYRQQSPNRGKDNFTIGVAHAAKIVYGVLTMVLVLSMFNINVKEAITSLSLIAAALVLITKDYISNLINGMYLTFNKVINIGDQVQVGLQKGKIVDITLTNVHLLNDDDDIIYIPNNTVFSTDIINYTRRELKKSSIDFEVDVKCILEVEVLEQKIISSLDEFRDDIQSGSYNLKVQSVRHEFVLLKFQYILHQPLNKELDKKIRKHIIRFVVKLVSDLQNNS